MSAPRPLGAALGLLVSLALLGGCDDKPKTDAAATPASATASAQAAVTATATASATATAEPRKVSCPAGPQATFRDPNLETEVRRKLVRPKGPITLADLKNVRTLNLSGGKVDELDPCIFPALTGVKDIFLGPGDLHDLTPLSGLANLESLRASINKVGDVTPLGKLFKLDRLDLGRTGIRDLKPIGNLTNLTELQIDDTEVSDIGPLASCAKLERLSIKRTQVKDLTPLRELKKLKFLYTEGTPVDDLSPLAPLVARGLKINRN